jgi:hypothetical protein
MELSAGFRLRVIGVAEVVPVPNTAKAIAIRLKMAECVLHFIRRSPKKIEEKLYRAVRQGKR